MQLIELPHEAVRFYLSFHDTSPLDGGVAVRTIAKQKALSVEEIDGHVVATELGPQSTVEGKSVLNVHRMIGFQNSLIVLSTAIEEDRMSSPQVKEFFDHHLSAIIGSIRLAHARK